MFTDVLSLVVGKNKLNHRTWHKILPSIGKFAVNFYTIKKRKEKKKFGKEIQVSSGLYEAKYIYFIESRYLKESLNMNTIYDYA